MFEQQRHKQSFGQRPLSETKTRVGRPSKPVIIYQDNSGALGLVNQRVAVAEGRVDDRVFLSGCSHSPEVSAFVRECGLPSVSMARHQIEMAFVTGFRNTLAFVEPVEDYQNTQGDVRPVTILREVGLREAAKHN